MESRALADGFFYRNRPWYAGQFVRKITPKFNMSQKTAAFFTAVLNKQKPRLLSVLVRDVDKTFKKSVILLPTNNGDEVDFDFIESFTSELEGQQLEPLMSYLKYNEFDNRELLQSEQDALRAFGALEDSDWGKYRIGDLFDRVKTRKLPYKAEDLPKYAVGDYTLPCLTSSFQNQGLNYFAPRENATILRDVISIPSNSDVYRAYYQPREFTVLSDAYAIRWKQQDNVKILPSHYLFMVMCINKAIDLPIYSYKNKLGGWNIVKEKCISLPQKNGQIDFELMNMFISAIQKIVIKHVAEHYVADPCD